MCIVHVLRLYDIQNDMRNFTLTAIWRSFCLLLALLSLRWHAQANQLQRKPTLLHGVPLALYGSHSSKLFSFLTQFLFFLDHISDLLNNLCICWCNFVVVFPRIWKYQCQRQLQLNWVRDTKVYLRFPQWTDLKCHKNIIFNKKVALIYALKYKFDCQTFSLCTVCSFVMLQKKGDMQDNITHNMQISGLQIRDWTLSTDPIKTNFMAILIDSEIFCVQSRQFVLRSTLKESYAAGKMEWVHPLRNKAVISQFYGNLPFRYCYL